MLEAEWHEVAAVVQKRAAAEVAEWTTQWQALRSLQQEHVLKRQWRGGPRTLLAALGLQYRELTMTAGLGWLLAPEGHHGLGANVLTGLLAHLQIDGAVGEAGVRVELEEQRDETRADLVVYGPDWTVVVEAKVFAPEQTRQLDRLYEHWKDEPRPCFVFLTHGRRPPVTAVHIRAHWQPVRWKDIATITRTAADRSPEASPGVHDYIATLEAYHHA